MLKQLVLGVGAVGLAVGCAKDPDAAGVDAGGAERLEVSEEEAAGDNCEYGGVAIHQGADENADGELQAREITDTEFQCDDEPVFETRLLITELDVGDPDCPGGGTKMERGRDLDEDGELDTDEIESADFLCSPVVEPTERLVITELAVGDPDCPGGGSKLERGADVDGDGAIGAEEVQSTDFLCVEVVAPATLARAKELDLGDANCPEGGVAVLTGPDLDGDGVLSDEEATETSLVCDAPALVVTCAVPSVWSEEVSGCVLQTDWSGADLRGVSLASEYLAGIDFSGADLSEADLRFAELREANLTGTSLLGADLTSTSLVGTNLTEALLDGANLTGVDLRGTLLDGISATNLSGCPLHLPEGFRCPSLGASGLTLTWPGMSLTGFDLTGAELTHEDLAGLSPIGIAACPLSLPEGWSCSELGSHGTSLIGPGVDLGGLDLREVVFEANTKLYGVSFVGANLAGAVFGDGTDLSFSDFSGVNLNGASFGAGTNLANANLNDANLSNAIFGAGVNLRGASLKRVRLQGVDLSQATLEGLHALGLVNCPAALPEGFGCVESTDGTRNIVGPATDLSGANLTGANLAGLDLAGADLSYAVVELANLEGTNLQGATLSGVHAHELTACPAELPEGYRCTAGALAGPGVDLHAAELTGANLTDLDLTGANLAGANLTNADLRGSNLTGANLVDALVTGVLSEEVTFLDTLCPDGTWSNDNDEGRCF